MKNKEIAFNPTYSVNKKSRAKKIIISVGVGILGFFALCFLIFNLFFYRAYIVGISMQPTFNNYKTEEEYEWTDEDYKTYRDIAVVSRYGEYGRGDIVLLQMNYEEKEIELNGNKRTYYMEDEVIVKRIIAIGGDTLTLKFKSVGDDNSVGYCEFYVNDERVDDSYIGENRLDMNYNYFRLFCIANNLTQVATEDGFSATLQIEEGTLFVLGDNRGHSQDSLIFGAFSEDKMLGKVVYSYKYNETFVGALLDDLFSFL